MMTAAVLALIAGGVLTWHSAAAMRAVTFARSFAALAMPLPPLLPMLPVDSTQPNIGPGMPRVGSNAAKSAASSSKPGSVLFFHKYTSDLARPNVVNTLLTLTNLNPRDGVAVNLYYVHDCAVDQSSISLTANQTRTLLMSKERPNTTGYVIAVAVDSRGVPEQFNWLIGSATLHDASGHEATYNAVAVAKRTGGTVALTEGSASVAMKFDNTQYDRLPKVIAVDSIQNQNASAGAAVSTDVAVYSPLADLSGDLTQALKISAVAYDHNGRPYPETIDAGCGLRTNLGSVWTATPVNTFITPGNPGWASFAATIATKPAPVLGLSLTDSVSAAQHDARNMQVLSWLDTYTISLPLRPPTSAPGDVATLDQPDAVGGAAGASENKAGSILFFSRFASGSFGASQINLTNTHPTQKARLRIFFNGVADTPVVTETIITLLPNQTTTLNPQDFAPDQHGWVMAMVIDARALPLTFNYLLGSSQVSEPGGQAAAFNALAFARNVPGNVPRNPDVQTSDLLFDDANYDRLPATVAFNSAPSQVDNTTLLGYARLGATLLEPPPARGALLLTVFNDTLENASMTMGPTEAKLGLLRPSSTSPPIASIIPKGHRGWLKLTSSSPILAWVNNLTGAPLVTAPEGDWTGGLSGGGNFQILTTADSYLLKTASTNPNNHAPIAGSVPIGIMVEARRATGTIVRLDALYTSDPDPDDPLTYQWYDNDTLVSQLPLSDLKLSIGVHYIKLVVTDGSDVASAPDIQLVEVVDSMPPQITGVPSAITRVSGSAAGVSITFPLPTAYDMVDGYLPVSSSKQTGALFSIGTTTVVFSARDSHGNTASARMDVTVTKGTGTLPAKGGVQGDIAPAMPNINDQYLLPGETRNIPLEADDKNGDPVTFSLISTTKSAHIVDVDPVARKATLQIKLQPEDLVYNTIRVVANDGRGMIFTTLPFRVATSDLVNDDTGDGGLGTGGGGGGGGGGGDDGGGGGGDDGGGGPPPNHPPVAVAATPPATIKATSRDGASVHLDGSASNDPDNEPLTYKWTEGTQVIAEGALVDLTLPVGVHSIVLTVTDPHSATGVSAPVSVEILPRDLTLINVTPVRVPQFQTLNMTINGTGFNSGTKVSLTGSGITIVKYVSIEEDKIVITLKTLQSTPLGNRDMFLLNPNGISVKLSRAFYVAP